MASGASNSVNLLSVTPRVSEGKSSREMMPNSGADFGAQFKNELNKAQTKPAEKTANAKPAEQANPNKSAQNEVKTNSDQEQNSAALTQKDQLPNEEAAASSAQTEKENTSPDGQTAVNLAALLGLGAVTPQAPANTQAKQESPELLDHVLDGKAGLATDPSKLALEQRGDATKQDLLQGDGQSKGKDQSALNLQLGAANIAVKGGDAAENLPLGAKHGSDGAGVNFVDELAASKLNVMTAQPAAVNTPTVNSTAHTAANAAATTAATHYIDTPVHDDRWGEVVAQRVSMMLGKQEQQIEMQLNPPNLGPMEVRLNLGNEQASVIFTSQHASVREALAAATPKLTALLADQGIVLQNVQVASDSLQQHQQNQQSAFSQQQSNTPYQESRQLAATGAMNVTGAERLLNLNELRVPVGTTRVSLFV